MSIRIEIKSIENGVLVEFKKHSFAGIVSNFYPDWNQGIDVAIKILEDQKYTEEDLENGFLEGKT